MKFTISSELIDPAYLTKMLHQDAAGACVTFEGRVRDHNDGQTVRSLSYQVFHELAVKEGQKILTEAQAKFGLLDGEAVHREGDLSIGDCAVWVGVLTPHRAEAFAACRYIIDEIKHRLPIWKKEFYTNGRAEWVNCQHNDHHHHPVLNEQEFYSRQTRLSELGHDGQATLKAARVLVVGAGGLGSAALPVLAAAGIGTIGIVEHDVLEMSNLHRQTLYEAKDIGKRKVELAATRLKALNPFIKVETHPFKATIETIPDLFTAYDLILDCTDNFETKYLLNDAAILLRKPLIQSSLYRFEGQILTIDTKSEGGCLRCLWPEPPATGLIGDCSEVGVLGSVPAMFGALQAHQVIEYFLGLHGEQKSTLFTFDMRSLTGRILKRKRRHDCALCGDQPSIASLISKTSSPYEIVLDLNDTREVLLDKYLWIDVREAAERAVLPLPEAYPFPLSQLDQAQLSWPSEKPLLVICAKGRRSCIAAEILNTKGYKAYSLKGGISQLPASRLARAV